MSSLQERRESPRRPEPEQMLTNGEAVVIIIGILVVITLPASIALFTLWCGC